MSVLRSVVLITALSCISCAIHAQDGVDSPKRAELKPDIERLVNWLPVDTETLLVSQQPWTYEDMRSVVDDLDPDEATDETIEELKGVVFRGLPAMLLLNAPTPDAGKALAGQNIVLALNAGRNFGAPRVEGLGSFECCEFIVVDETAQPALEAIWKRCEDEAARSFEHAGVMVHVLDVEESGSETVTLHFCRPEASMLVCARGEDFLRQVLIRRNEAKHEDRALPASLPEWELVNTSAAVWGIRHYHAKRAKNDRSSPLSPVPAIPWQDQHAIGITFAYQPGAKAGIIMNHLTKSENAIEACKVAWSVINEEGGIEAKRVGSSAIEVAITPDSPYAVMNMWMMTSTYFGYMMML